MLFVDVTDHLNGRPDDGHAGKRIETADLRHKGASLRFGPEIAYPAHPARRKEMSIGGNLREETLEA